VAVQPREPTVSVDWVAKLRDRLGTTPAERLIASLMIGCVALGIALRVRGFLIAPTAFWLDECVWAMHIVTRPVMENWVRPIGFITVSKALATWFSPTEMVLRALPWAAGVATVLAAPAVAKRLYRGPGARLLFVAILALNPCAIDFSKEFKPYSLGLLLHLVLAGLTLRYAQTKRASHLAVALGVATLGGLFTQDLVFAYPGVFLVAGWEAFRSQRRHLPAVIGCAGLVILGLFLQYHFIWSRMPATENVSWGHKYNVFHTAEAGQSYLAWSVERYHDMVTLAGFRRDSWRAEWLSFDNRQELRSADQVIWFVMHVVGLAVLAYKRRLREALLIALPLLVLWVFNRAGMWPLGAFRTNVFTIFYGAAIAAMAIDLPASERASVLSPIPTLVLVFLPLALFERDWNAKKSAFTYDSRFPEALARLVAAREPRPKEARDFLVFDRRTCYSYLYYTQFHPRGREQFAEALEARYEATCVKDDSLIPSLLRKHATPSRWSWVVLHTGKPVSRDLLHGRVWRLYRMRRFDLGGHRVMAFRPRGGR